MNPPRTSRFDGSRLANTATIAVAALALLGLGRAGINGYEDRLLVALQQPTDALRSSEFGPLVVLIEWIVTAHLGTSIALLRLPAVAAVAVAAWATVRASSIGLPSDTPRPWVTRFVAAAFLVLHPAVNGAPRAGLIGAFSLAAASLVLLAVSHAVAAAMKSNRTQNGDWRAHPLTLVAAIVIGTAFDPVVAVYAVVGVAFLAACNSGPAGALLDRDHALRLVAMTALGIAASAPLLLRWSRVPDSTIPAPFTTERTQAVAAFVGGGGSLAILTMAAAALALGVWLSGRIDGQATPDATSEHQIPADVAIGLAFSLPGLALAILVGFRLGGLDSVDVMPAIPGVAMAVGGAFPRALTVLRPIGVVGVGLAVSSSVQLIGDPTRLVQSAPIAFVAPFVDADVEEPPDFSPEMFPTVNPRARHTMSHSGMGRDCETDAPPLPPPPDEAHAQSTVILELDRTSDMAVTADGQHVYFSTLDGQVLRAEWSDEEPLTPEVVIDLVSSTGSGLDQGLLSLAVDRNEAWLYLLRNFGPASLVVEAYPLVDPVIQNDTSIPVAAGVTLLAIPKTEAFHSGGAVRLDRFGDLWVSFGDGGPNGDPELHALDLSRLEGSVVRIVPTPDSVDHPYEIPAENPFVDREGARPEIVFAGLRNPFRFALDAKSELLVIGDVGENCVEELTVVDVHRDAGRHLEWPLLEGDRWFAAIDAAERDLEPSLTYGRSEGGGCAIVAGPWYGGSELRDLDGQAVFADLCTGSLYAASLTRGRRVPSIQPLGVSIPQPVSIVELPNRELAVVSLSAGIHLIEGANSQ